MKYELYETDSFTNVEYEGWEESERNIYSFTGEEAQKDWNDEGNPNGIRAELAYLQMSPQKDGSFYWEMGQALPFVDGVITSGSSNDISQATEQASEAYKKLGLDMEGINDFK